ncbi:hypothetical protein Tcan_01807, partial [Toxocara canis]
EVAVKTILGRARHFVERCKIEIRLVVNLCRQLSSMNIFVLLSADFHVRRELLYKYTGERRYLAPFGIQTCFLKGTFLFYFFIYPSSSLCFIPPIRYVQHGYVIICLSQLFIVRLYSSASRGSPSR